MKITGLEPFAIDGLDRVLCRALAEHGVTTIEALADADVDALARHTGLSITRLMHVRFLARRREREQTLQPRPPLPPPTSVQPVSVFPSNRLVKPGASLAARDTPAQASSIATSAQRIGVDLMDRILLLFMGSPRRDGVRGARMS